MVMYERRDKNELSFQEDEIKKRKGHPGDQ